MSEGDRLNETAVHSLTVDGAHETVFSPETQQTALLSVPDMHLSQRRKSKQPSSGHSDVYSFWCLSNNTKYLKTYFLYFLFWTKTWQKIYQKEFINRNTLFKKNVKQ